MARAMLDAARTMDVSDQLVRVTAPTMVLHREGSTQMPEEVSEELVGAIPNAQLVRIPGTIPSLFFEHPAEDVSIITSFVVDGIVTSPHPVVPGASPVAAGGLTHRETEVLALIAAGESNAEIAHRLGITVNTVERHAANLYRKIDARGRADATAWAVRHGLG
jgi:DNA-binding CsgD family transcriptional regulator